MLEISKCLADATRSQLVRFISQSNHTACVSIRAEFKLSQPTISHHLAKLVEVGLVKKNKVGTENYYSINQKKFEEYIKQLKELYVETK